MGVSTNGSTCVQGSPKGVDSLFIIGGITGSTNSSAKDYAGLQRYIFEDKKWEQLKPSDTSAKDRIGHSSAYLNATSSILIYAGSQDGMFPSSQTFSISAVPPYTVKAHDSGQHGIYAPPLVKPLILPYNDSHALMLGGSSQNKDLWTFALNEEWRPFPLHLEEAIKEFSKVQAVISNGSDGSKLLELFDISASPNSIDTLQLQKPTGNAIISRSSTVYSQQTSRKRKRETALTERPPYNSTLASHTSRNGFSIAQDSTGLVVVSGGTPDDKDYTLCLFNETGNRWIDTVQFFEFGTKSEGPEPTPTALIPSVTQSVFTSSTSAPIPRTESRSRPLTILGATLGAVFGLAAIIIILLLLLRFLRRRDEAKTRRRTSEYALGDKQEMDFTARGGFMREPDNSLATSSNHKHMDSGHSTNSLGIMSGNGTASSPRPKRGLFHKPADSGGSTKSFFSRTKSPLAPSPAPQVTTSPEPRTAPRTDTGWSRYFADGSAADVSQSPPGNTRHDSSRPTTYSSNSQSDYASSRITSSNAHISAEVQPLSLRTNNLYPPNSRVVSPTSGLPLPSLALSPGGPETDPPSPSSLVSDVDEEEYHHEQAGSEGMASWTPVGASDRGSTWTDRPISSVYADSMIYPHPGERVRIPNFPRVPSTTRNPTARNSQVEPLADARGMRSVASRDLRSSSAEIQDRGLPEVGSRRVPPSTGGNSPTMGINHTPRGRPHEPEDMSWLNLGR